jgi:predicted flap endonuclease-1-like 5' DNA nuclease
MKAGAPEQTQVVSPDTPEQRRIVSPDTYELLSPLVAAIYESLTANSGISVTGNIGELDIDLQFKFLSRNDGREKLSAATGIDSDTILTKATKPDLERVKGVGMKYAMLLRASGVNTMPELASRNAANLTKKMAEVNAKEQILKEPPSADTVSGWVEDAKKLLVRKV